MKNLRILKNPLALLLLLSLGSLQSLCAPCALDGGDAVLLAAVDAVVGGERAKARGLRPGNFLIPQTKPYP